MSPTAANLSSISLFSKCTFPASDYLNSVLFLFASLYWFCSYFYFLIYNLTPLLDNFHLIFFTLNLKVENNKYEQLPTLFHFILSHLLKHLYIYLQIHMCKYVSICNILLYVKRNWKTRISANNYVLNGIILFFHHKHSYSSFNLYLENTQFILLISKSSLCSVPPLDVGMFFFFSPFIREVLCSGGGEQLDIYTK